MGDKDTKNITIEEVYTLLKSVSYQNTEIKNKLDSLEKEILDIRKENSELKGKNIELTTQVKSLERKDRENNLVFYNVKYSNEKELHDIIIHFLREKLNITLPLNEIVRVYRLGKFNNREISPPVLLKLTTYLRKREILINTGKLKGTGVSISEDLSEEERNRRKLIYSCYKAAKLRNCSAKLYKDKVIVDGKTFKYEDLVSQKALPLEEKSGISRQKSTRLGVFSVPDFEEVLGSTSSCSQPVTEDRTLVETRSRSSSKSSVSSLERASQKKINKLK